ncbi:Dicer-like protein 1 [Purpureocillium takamizusanense]|uniref:Dicer-like protein 1 n=1 Tax=Purpureocillium takamizusanense TaxID=2060973 RepID=A0A9Q8QCJ5_9HYPO|nr:Dicer-like protein 1 [Purpureocillium takamizusanense]UNI16858.1 Dicer-like protein 1 [Purpureocillium takamizusanense]
MKDEDVALGGDASITEPDLPENLREMALNSGPAQNSGRETDGEPVTDQDTLHGDVDGDGSSDSDDDAAERYRLSNHPEIVRGVSALRRRGDAAFHQWVQRSQRLGSKHSVSKRAHDLDRSSAARMIQSNGQAIIATPREYQIELFERAKDKNLIIVLDTGSGKTLIAALLLRHTLDQELERRARGEPNKIAFFLVEKVALCFQQYSVLKANLEHPIDKFHGEIAGIMRTKAFWDKRFSESMVIVCTAQILLDCLNSGFIQMQQINLLIFDEAHHTKKNHPYARIIKDHYLREQAERPRILGMTASPVDAQTRDLRAAALELEAILCSQIATVSDETLAKSLAQRNQVELREYYSRLTNAEDARTPLCRALAELMSHDVHYRIHFEAAQDLASTLGSWCADKYWELLLTDAEVRRRAAKAQGTVSSLHAPNGTTEVDRVLVTLQKAQRAIRATATANAANEPAGDSSSFSSKVILLRRILQHSFARERTGRCIVFVQKRHTALLLSILFSQPDKDVPGMSSSYLIGSQPLTASVANMSFREQALTLQKFRRGEFNCLFATQVAEEGLDIPECDLVVRFDLYDSAIQYIQSKGRARQANSTYISMLEEGNMQHLRRLKQATRDANALRRFCSGLPADRKIQDTFDVETLAEHERIAQKVYEIPETGARLTFSSSQEVLAKFVSSLGGPDLSLSPEYVVTPSHISKKFVATIIFPDASPFKSIKGFAQRNKQLARCSAAFEACVELIKKKYIDSHLQPTLSKRLPAMRNARLALSENKRHEYNIRVKPAMWSGLGSDLPTQLYHSVFVLDSPDAVHRPTRPIIFLTRQRLPDTEPMLLFFDQGRTSIARLVSSSKPLRLSLDELHDLASFTLAIFSDVFSKDYNAQPADMPYFLAPCARVSMDDGSATVDPTRIDWETVTMVSHSEPPEWRAAPEHFFHDKLVIDPWDGSRKFIIHGINKTLKPSDPVPESAPMPKSRAYRQVEPNIKEYSNSLTIHSRRRQTWGEDQPVVNATLLPLRRNFLDEYTAEDNQEQRCCIILEPLRVSKLPVDVVSMAMIIPVMIYRLDSVLIALEACKLLDLDIRPNLALEALTKDSSNTEEHGEVQVDFQVGMGNNYERLEFLGDAFLKMATTISLFTLIPNTNEFEYHVERMLLVCNQNLFNHAVDRKLQEFVRSKAFDRRTWYPDLKLKRGKMPKLGGHFQSLSDKSIADVCEALIGAAYVTQRESGKLDLAVKAVTKMVRSKNHKMLKFSEYYDAFEVPGWQNAPASAAQRAAVDQVYETTGYRFNCPNLLRSSFKHPSYPYEPVPNYQRLEFLGDALLDLVIVDYLFRRFPDADPQWLTEHKMAMVSNHFFGSLCVQLGLQKHLLMTTSSLIGQISDYVAELELARELAQPEQEPDEAKGTKDYWLRTSQPPKVLSDMLEALVGAMFVDSRYDYGVVEGFFNSFIEPYFEDMALYDTYASRHPVTALAHMLQKRLGCQNWRLYVSVVPCGADQGAAAVTGDDAVCALMVHEKVVEHDTAKVGRDAKLAVAKMALRRLADMERDAFQREMGCDCRIEDGIEVKQGDAQ